MTCRVQMAPMDQTVSSAVSVSTVTCLVTMSMELAIATWDTLATYVTRVSDTLPSHVLSSKCVCMERTCLLRSAFMPRLQWRVLW